ncbi:MAG TPA: NUDIX domain-containing protein [Candidatus Paceibacterota bacterium]
MSHIHEQIDFVADVFIVYRDKVFLRMHDKLHVWLSPGGHIELDEEPNHAAIREAKEEAGLDIELVGTKTDFPSEYLGFEHLIPPRFLNIHNIGANHKHISFVYFARTLTDAVKPSGDDISNEWRWLAKSELEKNELGVLEPTRTYALTALSELSS